MTTIDHSPAPRRLLRLGQVQELTGMSRSWLYAEIAKGRFPRPVKLGAASVWDSEAIEDWIAAALIEAEA